MSVRSLAVRWRGIVLCGLASGAILAMGARPAGATVITASPVDFSAVEQSPFSGTVATFTDSDPNATPDQFVAVIGWGDGSKSFGTISASGGGFIVSGQHTYPDEGSFAATVTVTEQEPGDGFSQVTDTATVSEADVLSGTPRTFAAPPGASFTTTVATFSDALTTAVASDFLASIDWGDATTSAGTVSGGGGGTFEVSGTHTYAAPGTYAVKVTLSDDPPGTATATVTSTAQVAAGLGVAAVSFSVPEGTAFNGQVATFSDADTSKTAADFTATIAWGDGTTSAGTVTGGSGSFTVNGQHTYADEGSFAFTVTVTEIGAGGATASGMATATVTEADVLAGTPMSFNALSGIPFSGPVATFTDANTANVAGDFIATIDWGDGQTSAGTVTGAGGSYTVSGTHTYAMPGTFAVLVTLADDAPGTATATVTSTATVTASLATIPTLDVWGLLALAGTLLAAALYVLRRKVSV